MPGGEVNFEWASAYLFAYAICKNGDFPPSERPSPLHEKFGVTHVNVIGEMYRWHAVRREVDNISADTRRKIVGYYVERSKISDLYVYRLTIRLRTEFVVSMLSETRRAGISERIDTYNLQINPMIHELCHPMSDLDGREKHWMRPHLLFLEPKERLFQDNRDSSSTIGVIQSIRDYFGYSYHYELPVGLQDMILVPGAGYGNHSRSCTMIREEPYERQSGSSSNSSFTIPVLAEYLLNQYISDGLKLRIGAIMRDIPLSSEAYWDAYSRDRDLQYYIDNFLNIRGESEKALLRSEEFILNDRELLPRNHIDDGDYQRFDDSLEVSLRVRWVKIPLDEIIKSNSIKADKYIRDHDAHLRRRLTRLDRFLNDAANMEAVRNSLLVAQRVRALTWVILVLTILSCAIALIPQEARERPLKALFADEDGTEFEARP